MKILPRQNKILRLWFNEIDALLNYWSEYDELDTTVPYNIKVETMILDNKDGYLFEVTVKTDVKNTNTN